MDAETLTRVEHELVAWDVVEPTDGSGTRRLTRRFRAAVARASATLMEEERTDGARGGNPVEQAVTRALADYALPDDAHVTDTHRRFAAAVELASLPDGVRRSLGG